LAAAAKRNGRVMTPNSQPENGGVYRTDHFEFSKRGVPSLYTGGGKDFIGKPTDFGQQKKTITLRIITIRSRTKLIRIGTSPVRCRTFSFSSKLATRSATAINFRDGKVEVNSNRSEIRW